MGPECVNFTHNAFLIIHFGGVFHVNFDEITFSRLSATVAVCRTRKNMFTSPNQVCSLQISLKCCYTADLEGSIEEENLSE